MRNNKEFKCDCESCCEIEREILCGIKEGRYKVIASDANPALTLTEFIDAVLQKFPNEDCWVMFIDGGWIAYKEEKEGVRVKSWRSEEILIPWGRLLITRPARAAPPRGLHNKVGARRRHCLSGVGGRKSAKGSQRTDLSSS